MEIAVE